MHQSLGHEIFDKSIDVFAIQLGWCRHVLLMYHIIDLTNVVIIFFNIIIV